MIINSWILMNYSRRSGNHSGTSHGSFRLFHFKSEIAKVLLKAPKLHQLPSTSVNATPQINETDEENEPPAKKVREVASSVPQLVRYNGFNHWPIFVSAINDTRCKNEKCFGKTYWECSKCNVHLCLNSTKNCFTQYHSEK